MTDTIRLDQHFRMSPLAAMKEMRRCLQIADHFAAKADDPRDFNPASAAAIRDEYRARAARLQQIAQPSAARMAMAH